MKLPETIKVMPLTRIMPLKICPMEIWAGLWDVDEPIEINTSTSVM